MPLPHPSGSPDPVYLDHAAATPLAAEVAAAMEAAARTAFANPSSPHAAGRHARRELEDARAMMAPPTPPSSRAPARKWPCATWSCTQATWPSRCGSTWSGVAV